MSDTLETLVETLDDPRIAEAAAGLRPVLRRGENGCLLRNPIVKFAPASFACRVDPGGAGTRVHMYGTDENGSSVSLCVSGFYPYLYVEVGALVPRTLIDELQSTLLLSLALDTRKWAPERRAAATALVGRVVRRGAQVYRITPSQDARMLPIVGYEMVSATILRGCGGDYGYRGIEARQLLKIYFYSPAILSRARSLLHGKNSTMPAEHQARALASSATRGQFADRTEAPVATAKSSMRVFLKEVDIDEGEAAARRTILDAQDENVGAALEQFDEMTEAVDEELDPAWRNDDTGDEEAEIARQPGEAVLAGVGHELFERLERELETKFESTARSLLRERRRFDGYLSRLSEAAPLKVCDGDIEFVLRVCTDCGIAPHAWVQIDTNAVLTPASARDERTGVVHSANGQHAGYPDATWMLDRTAPGIAPSDEGVIKVMTSARHYPETRADIELRCDFHHVVLVDDERMQENVAQGLRLSFDIETETGPNNTFPHPSQQGIINIGIAIPYPRRIGSRKKWRLIVFSVGLMAQGAQRDDADEFVLTFESERDALRALFAFLHKLCIDEFFTFNGHVFDFEFLEERARQLGLINEYLHAWSWAIGRNAVLRRRPRVFQSTAHGRHETFEMSAEGATFVDIYQVVLRNPGIKLKSYSLDSLSDVYLKDHKEKVSPADINGLRQTPAGRRRLKEYVLKDAMLPVRLDEKQKWILGMIEKARIVGCPLDMLIMRGMGVQCKSLAYRWCRRGVLIPEAAAAIGVADAGRYRLTVNYTRTDYDRAHEGGTYEGAVVLNPDIGLYVVPVATLDFNSLYPSEQASNNMCTRTLVDPGFDVRKDRYISHLVASGVVTWDTAVRRMRTMVNESPYRDTVMPDATGFLAHCVLDGLLPEIQRSNLSRRKLVRKKIEGIVDDLKAKRAALRLPASPGEDRAALADEVAEIETLVDVLDQRQTGFKLVANSLYGSDGSPQSFRFAPRIAAAVTQCGRCHIHYSKDIAENLMSLTLDHELVRRVSEFPGVKSLLVSLPPGKVAVASLMEQIAAMNSVTTGETKKPASSRDAVKLTQFFGTRRLHRSASSSIEIAHDTAQTENDKRIRVVYGDSVTGDTALLVRYRGFIGTTRIDALANAWMPYGDKECAEIPDLEIWQDGGFTPVERVIRHLCDKPIWRVRTRTGVVDCTADHSLLRLGRAVDGQRVVEACRPIDVTRGTELLHESDYSTATPTADVDVGHMLQMIAYGYGVFAAAGECDIADEGEARWQWAIESSDLALLMKVARTLGFPTTLSDEHRGVRTITTTDRSVVEKYVELFCNGAGEMCVPAQMLNTDVEAMTSFWVGYCDAAGVARDDCTLVIPNKELATGLWLIASRIGLRPSLVGADVGFEIRVTTRPHLALRDADCVVDAGLLAKQGPCYVYDLTTASSHFHVGPGNLVVHNTDSIFPRFWAGLNLDLVGNFCTAAADFISICMHVTYGTHRVGDCIFRLEFEKLAAAYLLVGKKKYAMLKYVRAKDGRMEPKPAENVLSLSGMEAGKRDTTRFVARGQEAVLSILLDRRYSTEENMKRAVAYIYRELVRPLQSNLVDPHDLIITKQLRDTVEAYTRDGRTAPVHVQLAARLMRRAGGANAANAPRPGDRLPFVIRRGDPKEPLSMRGEDPVYVVAHGVPIDDKYYLESLGACLQRIFMPLVTAHRTDLRTDREREAVAHEFVFNSKDGYAAPNDPQLELYDFSKYRDKADGATTIVRYPRRRATAHASSAFIRELRAGSACVGCGELLVGRRAGAVCAACMEQDRKTYEPALNATLERLMRDEKNLAIERAAIVYTCQKCAGHDKQYAAITCREYDCNVMWKRQANLQAIGECRARRDDAARSLAGEQ